MQKFFTVASVLIVVCLALTLILQIGEWLTLN